MVSICAKVGACLVLEALAEATRLGEGLVAPAVAGCRTPVVVGQVVAVAETVVGRTVAVERVAVQIAAVAVERRAVVAELECRVAGSARWVVEPVVAVVLRRDLLATGPSRKQETKS